MTDFLSISEIDSRRARIGLDARQLFRAAGVSQPTWNRALRGDDTSTATLKRLTASLLAFEISVLEHLTIAHPEYAAQLVAKQETGAAA